MEQEVMKTVLHEILQELSGQRVQLSHLQKGMEALINTSKEMEENVSLHDGMPVVLSEEQAASIKNIINEHFGALRTELIRHPATHTTHKHFALLPLTFRMEQFPLLVNTVMKWVVVLLVMFFSMWVIAGMVK